MFMYNRIQYLKFEEVAPEFRKHPEAAIQLPKRGTASSCGYDFYSPVQVVVRPFEKVMLWTDTKAKIPSHLALVINVRSSMGKVGIRLANTQGWVDADYYSNPSNDGNIGIYLENTSEYPYTIHVGDRVAQGMFIPYFVTEDDDTQTKREGGFGSTTSK